MPSLFFCLTLSPTQLLFLLFTEESHSSHLLFKILVFLNLCPSAMGWGDWHVCVFLYGCRSFAFKPADSDSGLIHLNNRLLVGNVLIKMKEQRRYWWMSWLCFKYCWMQSLAHVTVLLYLYFVASPFLPLFLINALTVACITHSPFNF